MYRLSFDGGDEKTFLSQGAFGLEILGQLSAGELPLM